MAREKGPGLKILWLWTVGTAAGTPSLFPYEYIIDIIVRPLCCWVAVLVTFVVKTRLRDMERLMDAQQDQSHQQPSAHDSIIVDAQPGPDDAYPQDKL